MEESFNDQDNEHLPNSQRNEPMMLYREPQQQHLNFLGNSGDRTDQTSWGLNNSRAAVIIYVTYFVLLSILLFSYFIFLSLNISYFLVCFNQRHFQVREKRKYANHGCHIDSDHSIDSGSE